jgi:hypothetical protein
LQHLGAGQEPVEDRRGWRVEIVINAGTAIAYLGTIPVPVGQSQARNFGIVDIATIMLRTAAASASASDTVAVSMVEAQLDPVHRGMAF